MKLNTQISTSNNFTFTFNGKTYHSLEEMPENIQKYFKDQNENGLPDVIDEKMPQIAKYLQDLKQTDIIPKIKENVVLKEKNNQEQTIGNNKSEQPKKGAIHDIIGGIKGGLMFVGTAVTTMVGVDAIRDAVNQNSVNDALNEPRTTHSTNDLGFDRNENYDLIDDSNITVHTVTSGQTLSEIARLHGTSVEKLVELNGIENPDLIHPGDEIKLP